MEGYALRCVEILGSDLVEELAELLDLVLLLGGYGEAGLVEHLLGADDAGAGAQRQGDRVGRPGATSAPEPKTRSAKKTPSLTSVIRTSVSSLPVASSTSFIRSWVSGRGGTTPCWAKAIAVASTAPIQIGR